ncbi:hypothetical protein MTO96_049961, partial [Rhipicephalus appendiculatus]
VARLSAHLEFCVYKLGSRDEAIHNYLLALYARLGREQPHVLPSPRRT